MAEMTGWRRRRTFRSKSVGSRMTRGVSPATIEPTEDRSLGAGSLMDENAVMYMAVYDGGKDDALADPPSVFAIDRRRKSLGWGRSKPALPIPMTASANGSPSVLASELPIAPQSNGARLQALVLSNPTTSPR
jgi:hypothetical protein